MTVGWPLMKSIITPLPKRVLIPLELSAGISAINAVIQKKNDGSDRSLDIALRITTLIILNEEMEDIIKIVQ